MPNGYNGKILHVDLTKGTLTVEEPKEAFYRKYLGGIAACDGALAVAYGTLDGRRTLATSAWRWVVFGFLPVEPLPGQGTPTCVDIDGDGRTEPAIMERSAR